MRHRNALVGFGHSVKEIELQGMKPLSKKTIFRHYKKCHRFAPELLIFDAEDDSGDPDGQRSEQCRLA